MREKLWSPTWEMVAGWTKKFIKENRWRVDQVDDFDDLLQDSYLVFRRVQAAYPRVTEPANFMALYKMALWNEFINKARLKQRKSAVMSDGDVALIAEHVATYDHDGYMRTALGGLSAGVKQALAVYDDPEKCKLLSSKKRTGIRENLNMALTRIAGLDTRADVIGELREALNG